MEKKILNTKLLEINSLREEKKLLGMFLLPNVIIQYIKLIINTMNELLFIYTEDKLKMEQLKIKQMEQKMDMIIGKRTLNICFNC